ARCTRLRPWPALPRARSLRAPRPLPGPARLAAAAELALALPFRRRARRSRLRPRGELLVRRAPRAHARAARLRLLRRGARALNAAKTLFERIWDAHVVAEPPGEPALLYVDLHLVHEVTSPQAFEALRLAGRRIRRPELTVATMDHNVPTGDRRLPIADQVSARQVAALVKNAREFGVELFDLDSPEQGIVHVIGPELGLTQ